MQRRLSTLLGHWESLSLGSGKGRVSGQLLVGEGGRKVQQPA